MERLHTPEQLDDENLDSQELERSLNEVWAVNRFLGGNRVLFHHLDALTRTTRGPLSILDVGTGSGDIPRALVEWGRRQGRTIQVVGVDVSPRIVTLARKRTHDVPNVRIEQADGTRLPYPSRFFDLTVCTLVLHHLDDTGAKELLSEVARVSRLGWLVQDLERHPWALGAARMLARFVWKSPVTRNDGPLSVQRAYRAAELRALVHEAGLRAQVHTHLPFRLAVVSRG